jgi:hypothetical protein
MKAPQAPRLDERRAAQFAAELQERARAWIPAWGLADAEQDFGRALLEIAARFDSEVAERLDGSGEKMRRGFLDWLAVRGQAARPARMPVVFKLTDAAREAVRAAAPVRLQADAAGTSVVFETEKDVRVVPGQLDLVVGVDADQDAFYLSPPGLNDLKPLESLPTEWRVKSFAAAGSTKLQLDPELGLLVGMLIDANGAQYTVLEIDNGLVTIDRPLESELTTEVRITKVTTFTPFEGTAYNSQQHSLYLGDPELLNVDAAATIEVVGADSLREGYAWQYWGKVGGQDEVKWQLLKADKEKQKTVNDAIVLTKPKGAIEELEIGGRKSRWIRAYRKTIGATDESFRNDEISLRINSSGCDTVPCPPTETVESPAADAFANNTPLPLGDEISPLGKEPRQFDAFYLGSEEAFSKAGAKVQLCFEMADANFAVLTSLRSGAPDEPLAGVAADRRLHLLSYNEATGRLTGFGNREPLRPPSPGPSGAAVTNPPVPLDPRPPYQVAMWKSGPIFFTAVAADGSVWVWNENTGNLTQSGWQLLGPVEPIVDSQSPIEGLVHLGDGAGGQLFALRESKLFVRDLNDADATWKLVETKDGGGNDVALTKIVPINIQAATIGGGTLTGGLVGTATNKALYSVRFSNLPLAGTCKKLLDDIDPAIAPAAVRRSDQRLVAVAVGNDPNDKKILGYLSTQGTFNKQADDDAKIEWPNIVGNSIDVNQTGSQLTFAFCAKLNPQTIGLHAWNPFDLAEPAVLRRTKISPQLGSPVGSPTLLPKHVIIPISTSEVIVASFDPSARLTKQERLRTAVIATAAEDKLLVGDSVAIPKRGGGPTSYQLETIAAVGVERRGQTLYEFNLESKDDDFFVYRASATSFTASIDDDDKLDEVTLPVADTETGEDSILLITTDKPDTALYTVVHFDPNTRIAVLDRDLEVSDPNSPPANISYKVPETTAAALRPLLRLNPATTGNWEADLLNRTSLVFPGAKPKFQDGTAFLIDAFRRPQLVALTQHWTTPPPHVPVNQVEFLIDGSVGEWTAQLGDTSSNPELSWEYWNGTGWWKLHIDRDDTRHFKRTGVVEFKIPEDLRPTDWSGKTNYWIRARLIGGDYGRETVTVHTQPDGTGTVQTVVRSSEGIRPPAVLKLNISYGVCQGVRPKFVQAEDSGTIRDQSDANRTAGAIVEAFVPLAVTLGRLSKGAAPESPEKCPPQCACDNQKSPADVTTAIPAATQAATSPRETGRSVFIGLKATPSEAPVNVLLLLEEKKHTAFAPMTIDALIADRFVPIVADDATRALGESGLLSMAFAVPPTPSELFGKTLTWLRLKPKPNSDGKWLPTLRGAYLNAVWASATETLTRELLGSSNGEPHLTVRLARPPVLYKTLELRVKEPLGQEEREALLKNDQNSVLSVVEGLSGDWVLWKQVVDPNDEPASARVYSLDENAGEICFGDGIHGKIPPIGRDSIVAFRYSRTEPDPTGTDKVPGNSITARAALNLVSPVESVETVTAADQAAGGAPPESDDRVLRFGFARLRHRDRAVTATDIEDLALQSSPDIVQAHAFVRRGFIRLVVVMRGKNPQPNAAQIRELRRLLLAAGTVSLSAPGALRIEGPTIRRLRIDLELQVESLDHAGALTDFVKQQFATFFDPATGGSDKTGWALGLNPNEGDIALALIDAPYLESIKDVKLREITGDGVRPSLETLKVNQLVMLDDDPVRIQFETAEVMV